jgi:hypothetical protein
MYNITCTFEGNWLKCGDMRFENGVIKSALDVEVEETLF